MGRCDSYISGCLSKGRKPKATDGTKFDVIVRGGKNVVLRIVIEVDAPPGQAIGIKEDLAMRLENLGKTRVVSVEEHTPQQTVIAAMR